MIDLILGFLALAAAVCFGVACYIVWKAGEE